MNNEQRKDPIIIDDSLIGREVYFNKFKGCKEVNYLTPNKKYKIIAINKPINLPLLVSDNHITINAPLNFPSNHLEKHNWLLAKRTSSSQSVVRTESGRKL